LYEYVGGQPTVYVDPSGLAKFWNPFSWDQSSDPEQTWWGFFNPFNHETLDSYGDGVLGVGQGGLNLTNGTQNAFTDAGNFYFGWTGFEVESSYWSHNLLVEQSENAHQWQTFIGGEAVLFVAGGLVDKLRKLKYADEVADSTKIGYRAVSAEEAADIRQTGRFRQRPDGRSMEDKWFSETLEGAEGQEKLLSNGPGSTIVEAEVPKSVYDEAFKHPNIDGTGPGFCVPAKNLNDIKPRP
jgi:hypothetical protein